MSFLSGDDGPTDFSPTPLRSAWYSRAVFRFFPQFLLFSRYYSHVFKWLPENSRMLNSSLSLLSKFKKKGAKHLSSLSFQFLTHLSSNHVGSITDLHSQFELFMFPPSPPPGLSYCAHSSFCPSDCFLHSNQNNPVMKASLCHLSAQDHPGLSHLIFAVAYEASFSLLLFLLHLL